MPTPGLILFTTALLFFTVSGLRADDDYDEHADIVRKCEPICIDSCRTVGYNFTSMPNLVGMEIQKDAEYQIDSFKPLVQYGCSSQLQFFLCSLYAPMCTTQVSSPIGPCRPLCENVKLRCAPVLLGLGLSWPPALNCSNLPVDNNEEHMCMEGPPETAPPPVVPQPIPRPPPPTEVIIQCAHYAHSQLYRYINATGRCAPLCYAHISFTPSDKEFATVWMAIWAVVCFVVTLFTALSFVVDAGAFRYPERAMVHMSLCYCAVSAGYLVRLAAGMPAISCHADIEHGVPVAVTEGTLHASCALVFLLLYYFSSAAAVWWVMLCVSWLLRAWRKSTHDQILRQSSWFHVGAWALPAVQSIACLLLRRVDADELTGTCYVGQQDGATLVRWVLVPQFVYLVSGAVLVLVVFACLWRSRCNLKAEGVSTNRIDVAAARVGIVSVIYMVPATCLVGSTFYEYVERPRWLQDASVRPNMEVFMLKVFMSLASGIFGALFLANSRVLSSWRSLFHRLSSSKQPLAYLQAPQQLNPHHHAKKTAHNSLKKNNNSLKIPHKSLKTHHTSIKLPHEPLKAPHSSLKTHHTSFKNAPLYHEQLQQHQQLTTPVMVASPSVHHHRSSRQPVTNKTHQHLHHHHHHAAGHHHINRYNNTGSETTV